MMDDFDIQDRNSSAKVLLRIFGIFAIMAVLAVPAYLLIKERNKRPEQRDPNGCIVFHPDGVGVSRRTAILIDATTRIESEMADAVMPRLSIFIDQNSKPEERFALFSVSDKNYRSAREEAAFCRPTRERGWTKAPQDIERDWRRFSKELEKSIRDLSDIPESDFSPIMETIDSVTEDPGNGEHFDRLVIFSDMMAHMPSKSFTHYGSKYPAPDKPHPYLDETGENLRGMQVIVCYIVRPEGSPEAIRQSKEHRNWWRKYFSAKNVKQPLLIGEVYKTQSGKYNAKCL